MNEKEQWVFIYWDDWRPKDNDIEEKPQEHPQDN
jgi:hypothetical protein